jgi:hypothetical protein
VLPAAVKKKISQADYEALDLEGKEKLYKPFQRASVKRITSRLDEDHMWGSFHDMYERFIDKNATYPKKKICPSRHMEILGEFPRLYEMENGRPSGAA